MLLTVLAVGCGDSTSQDAAPSGASGDVVARFGDLEITTAELDERILSLPATERPGPGTDLDAWYSEQIRELVVERRLRDMALTEAEVESLAEARAQAEKQLAVQLCLVALRPNLETVTEDDLRAAYAERVETFRVPERRYVLHLFQRRDPKSAQARAEIEALRDRVLRGEGFQRLAVAHSDSESRHRDGVLGWMRPGDLPKGFENIVFALEEGVPSEPVVTRDGFHLFYVDQSLPAREVSFDEARKVLHEQLTGERRAAALAEIEAEIEPPVGAVLLDRDIFREVVSAGDPDAVVLRVEGFEVTLGDLRRDVLQARARQEPSERGGGDLAWTLLQGMRHRELIYHHCRAQQRIPEDELASRLAVWRERAELETLRRRRLLETAQRDEDRLRLFYESNLGNFSKPPTWTLRRLRLPLDERVRTVMARLERAAAQGGTDLDTLHGEFGGEVEDLGAKNLTEIGRLEAKLPVLVAPLEVGDLSAPYRNVDNLEIVQVTARAEAEPLPFDEIRERVAAAYVEQYTREVYDALADEILQKAELQILPEGLAALRDAGMPQSDEVSVEDLEALLEEL